MSTILRIAFLILLLIMPLLAIDGNGLAVAPSNNPWKAGKIGDEADTFFDDSYVHEIRLYFNDPNWYTTLYNAHDKDPADPYFPARFVSHGITINSVGVRFKGLSSFGGSSFPGGGNQGVKKSFRIDFNEYDENGTGKETTFFGLKKLDLNNGFADPTMLREKLFMDFASRYVETPRSVYTRLYINDQYYGLYLAMEHIDNTFVESRFGRDEDGNIYKVEYGGTLEYRGPDWTLYNGSYELKNNEETNNWSDLIELTDILTNTPLSELPSRLETIFDVESGIRFIALLSLFSNLDSYIGNARNYYLYHREDTGKFVPLLWDANLAFGSFRLLLRPGEDPATLDPFPPPTTRSSIGQPAGRNLTLIKNMLAVESYNRTYLRFMAQMLREGFNSTSVNARVQELASMIRTSVYEDPNFLYNQTAFESGLSSISNFVATRAAYLDSRLNDFSRKTDLKINELMTNNLGVTRDQAGDYDPWVEIYNSGPGRINTSGIYLTDEQAFPNKWALPLQTLNDGQFMLLWLDNETAEGSYHAPLRLNSNGGSLYLFMRVGSNYVLVDSVTYPALVENTCYGRYPDGVGEWLELKEYPTPAQPNQLDGIPNDLFINEFMADNKASVQSPDGKYSDWIELYNGGNKAVDISGMYLTDDLANPTTWRFPNGTLIGAKSYLLVWADKSSSSNGLHANFALDADGEKIGLFAKDGKRNIDYVVFSKQFDDASYGRYPDGSPNWNYLAPTAGSANQLGPRSVGPTPTPTPTPSPTSSSPAISSSSTSQPRVTPSPSPITTTSPPQTATPTPTAEPPTCPEASPIQTAQGGSAELNMTVLLTVFFMAVFVGVAGLTFVLKKRRQFS
ncbi:MAG: CotH kinase family protein [Candidatus Bathyarchaeia archaeon]